MSATTRLYKVTSGKEVHLVDAANPAQAIRHVVSKKVKAEIAAAKDVALMVVAGVRVEYARKESEPVADEEFGIPTAADLGPGAQGAI